MNRNVVQMTELLTSEQMRGIEKAAIERGEVTGLHLMERAGQGVCDAILAHWSGFTQGSPRVLILCGPGNNGGDGFVIARLLDTAGWLVTVHLMGDPHKLPPDARVNHDIWAERHKVLPLTTRSMGAGPRPDMIVDAVFGIGLTRPLARGLAEALDPAGARVWERAEAIRRVAVDCPSGLNLDTGIVPNESKAGDDTEAAGSVTVCRADLTVTFHAPKLGHFLGAGPQLCGTLRVVDIGLDHRHRQDEASRTAKVGLVDPTFEQEAGSAKTWLWTSMGKPKSGAHKYDHGHVMVFAGGVGRGGAARLAARSALRAGAGLVTVVCPPAALIENACQLNAVMLQSLGKDTPVSDVADARASAFCLGPGMGLSDQTRSRVAEVLERRAEGRAQRDPAVVLDADALTSFAPGPETLFEMTHARTILTPHEGEFARLFPDLSEDSRKGLSKVDVVRRAAARAGCIILLKGSDTVIAGPDGAAAVHVAAYGRDAPWIATAGAGDVLAGLIAGLAAPHESASLFDLAGVAVWLHVESARSFGPGLIAEDLPEALPDVFRSAGL